MQTTFKLVVSAADEGTILVPDTGFSTTSGVDIMSGSQPMLIALLVIAIVLAAILAYRFIRYRVKSKMGFNIVPSKGSVFFRSLLTLVAVALAGYAGGSLIKQSGSVNAIEVNGVDVSTAGELTVEASLNEDESTVACGVDSIKISQALPAGYKLSAFANNLISTTNENDIISTIESDGELSDGTWGYSIIDEAETDDIHAIPATMAVIKTVDDATAENDITKIKYCVKLAPETEPGTYTSTISYSIDPTELTYSLDLDANGGTFEEQPETQVSPATIATSYEFEIPDVTPIVPSTPAGLNFYGWSLTGDSLSDIYVAGDKITVQDVETTLKAVYGFRKYTITYEKNTRDEVANFISEQLCIITEDEADSCDVVITKRVPARSGYTLLGWSNEAYTPSESDTIDTARSKVDYKPGDQITIDEDITLYAVWWAVSSNDFQMELRWGENPSDLDSHLIIIRNSDNTQIGHVFFNKKTFSLDSGNINLSSKLDIDDTTSYGPETLTMNLLPLSAYSDYTFYYFIRNYSGESRGTIKESGANVTLIRKNGETTVYDAEDVSGNSAEYWNVFAIKNGQIVNRNTFSNSPEIAY